jgi:hypothetical protein
MRVLVCAMTSSSRRGLIGPLGPCRFAHPADAGNALVGAEPYTPPMNDDTNMALVAGEPRELLRRAFACLTVTKGRRGEGILSGQLPRELAEPFNRALMRTEAELLLDDAEAFTAAVGETRTQSERRADAFTALVLGLGN